MFQFGCNFGAVWFDLVSRTSQFGYRWTLRIWFIKPSIWSKEFQFWRNFGAIWFDLASRQSQFGSRRSIRVRASSATSSGSSSSSPIAPLQLESPVGQFLSQILISHPHLLFAAVEQQLDQLQTDREAEKKKEEPTPSGSELVLYR